MLRVGMCIGRADHSAERMSRHMNFLMTQFPAQRFEIFDQVFERIGRRWNRAFAVTS